MIISPYPLPIWAWHEGQRGLMECLRNTSFAFKGGYFSLFLHSCEKDFLLLFLTALSSTEASGGETAEGREATVRGESCPFSETCPEMSRAEGCARLFLSRAGSICLWGNLQGTAGLSRVTLIYSYSFLFVSEVKDCFERHFQLNQRFFYCVRDFWPCRGAETPAWE